MLVGLNVTQAVIIMKLFPISACAFFVFGSLGMTSPIACEALIPALPEVGVKTPVKVDVFVPTSTNLAAVIIAAEPGSANDAFQQLLGAYKAKNVERFRALYRPSCRLKVDRTLKDSRAQFLRACNAVKTIKPLLFSMDGGKRVYFVSVNDGEFVIPYVLEEKDGTWFFCASKIDAKMSALAILYTLGTPPVLECK